MRNCDYCQEDKDGHVSGLDKNGHVWIHDPDLRNELMVRYYGNQLRIRIKYCPMCGRKLKGEQQ